MVSSNCCLSTNVTPMERFRRYWEREEVDEKIFSVKYIGSTAVSHPGTDELCRAINEVYSQKKHKLSHIESVGLTLSPTALYLGEFGDKDGHMSFVIKRVVYCGVDRMRQKIFAFMYKSSEVVYGVLDCQVIYCKTKNDAKTLALTLSNYFHGPKTSIKTGIPPPAKRFNNNEKRKDLDYRVFPLQSRANDIFEGTDNNRKGKKDKLADEHPLQVNLDKQEIEKENTENKTSYTENRYTTLVPQKDQCSPEDSVVEDDGFLNYEAEDEDEDDDDEEDETSDDPEHIRHKRDWIMNIPEEDQQCDTSTSTSSYAELKSCSKCGSVISLSKLAGGTSKTLKEMFRSQDSLHKGYKVLGTEEKENCPGNEDDLEKNNSIKETIL